MHDITHILEKFRNGENAHVQESLYEAVYGELRAMAARKMASERPGHTLQATALVNEAYLRLTGSGDGSWQNRAHFFSAAAEAMRRILVDSARRKQQLKRGGKQLQVPLDEAQFTAPVEDEKLLLVNEALETLAKEDPLKAEIVKLRYFVGLKHDEIAQALNVNEKTVRRHWQLAKIRLFEIIGLLKDSREAASLQSH